MLLEEEALRVVGEKRVSSCLGTCSRKMKEMFSSGPK